MSAKLWQAQQLGLRKLVLALGSTFLEQYHPFSGKPAASRSNPVSAVRLGLCGWYQTKSPQASGRKTVPKIETAAENKES
jgi:hypothetical protein